MSQYNKLSYFQYAGFQVLAVSLYFRLFLSAGIPTMQYTHLTRVGGDIIFSAKTCCKYNIIDYGFDGT